MNTYPDELLHDAILVVRDFGKASTTLLQRRLRIGYGRAVHLLDLMEAEGVVGKADAYGKRELLPEGEASR